MTNTNDNAAPQGIEFWTRTTGGELGINFGTERVIVHFVGRKRTTKGAIGGYQVRVTAKNLRAEGFSRESRIVAPPYSPSGYTPCPCPDCFNVAIDSTPCGPCEDADCSLEGDCNAEGAYGC